MPPGGGARPRARSPASDGERTGGGAPGQPPTRRAVAGTIGRMTDHGPAPRTVVVDGRTFERVPIRTPVLMPGNDMARVIREHAGAFLRPGDTVVMSESAVAIMQGRARDWRTIRPSRFARFLSGRVLKTTYGT